ncbi:MAG: hypothetical protein IPQ03_12545 [Bacteroidetes bacterium]|nr:hypothetical protein [Bacteroidota bacterium]
MIIHFLALLFFIIAKIVAAQVDTYAIRLKPEDWGLKPQAYFICGIEDKRHSSGNDGKVLSAASGKPISVKFENGMEKEIHSFIAGSLVNDTGKIPLWIGIDELVFKDPGTASKHTLSLNFSMHVFRVIDGKEIELYQTSGTPQMAARGFPKEMPETILRQTFKQILTGFDDWVNKNPNQVSLCKSVQVEFVKEQEAAMDFKKDTLHWTPSYSLKWTDFQGPVDQKSPFSAQSHCLFDYKAVPTFQNQVMVLNVSLFACFAKKGSWVQKDKKEIGLLAHEQLHFDICELFIRKLKKKISETPLGLLECDQQLKTLFEEAWKSYQDAQFRYDEETEHGVVPEYQKSWTEQVRIEMDELKDYSGN